MTSMTDLRQVSVEDVTLYLRSTGWSEAADLGGRATVWALDRAGLELEVVVPASARFLDYPQRIKELIRALSDAEERPEEEVILNVTEPYVDRQYFRTFPDSPSGTIPAADGAEAFVGIRELLIAAAQAEYLPRSGFVLPKRKPKVVEDFPKQVLLTTEPGSFIIASSVRLPHDDALFTVGDPFERRVLTRLRQAVTEVREAAAEASELAELTPFTDRSGINKTLCRALSRLGGTDNDHAFEVRFSWASAVPSEAPPDTVRFDAVHVAMLRHAAEDLGRKPYREEAQMVGHIRRMERHHLNGPGWIVVHGHITTATARRPRQAWVRLQPGDYERALSAHAQDRMVRIAGVLTHTGHRTEFIAPAVFDA